MDKRLFTPGPLSTSLTVKAAMLRDLGSRDAEFLEIVSDVRSRLLDLAGVSQKAGYEAILMQGAGTFGIESVLGSVIPDEGLILLLVNGAYGRRMQSICGVLGIRTCVIEGSESIPFTPQQVERALEDNPDVTHVAIVHCETTTGVLNPVEAIGASVRKAGKLYIVDSMSAFGAVPVCLVESAIDFLVTSSNKCVEGVPGFSVVLCRREALCAQEGRARSFSLDLCAQWRGLEKNGQFRFTPPTHSILAFHQALIELQAEGGVTARGARYKANQTELVRGMRLLGFEELLAPESQGNSITTFLYLAHASFEFERLYSILSDRGLVIYPGKLSRCDSFRIGTCGQLQLADIQALLAGMGEALAVMGIPSPVAAK